MKLQSWEVIFFCKFHFGKRSFCFVHFIPFLVPNALFSLSSEPPRTRRTVFLGLGLGLGSDLIYEGNILPSGSFEDYWCRKWEELDFLVKLGTWWHFQVWIQCSFKHVLF